MIDHIDKIALRVIAEKADVHKLYPDMSEDHIKDEVMMRLAQRLDAPASPAPTPEGWRRIETAPRDGNYVIVTGHGRVDMRSAKSGEQTTDMLGPKGWDFPSWATHWQPLPVPPPASIPEED